MTVALFQQLETRIREVGVGLIPEQQPARVADHLVAADVGLAVADARRKAAVVGWFNPKTLVDVTSRALKERVLSAVVPDCDVRVTGPGYVWCLRREARRAALSELAADREALARVLRETAALAGDADSRLLRRVLRGQRLKPERASDEDRAAMLRVAEWTDGIFPKAPKPAEVQGILARDAIKQSLSILVEKFHGRERELEVLRQFVAGPRAKSRPPVLQAPVLAVSGIGGVGKSALLSRFTSRLFARPKTRRPAVVLIDFDRARFSSGDPVALTLELTRQIGAWFPSLAAELRELRHSARTNQASSGFASPSQAATANLESFGRSHSELIYRLPRILSKAGVGTRRDRPLIVIFDTFEVLQGARTETTLDDGSLRGVHAVAEWISDLFVVSRLSNMRVVVAGRAPIAEDPIFGEVLTEPELRLTGVDRSSGIALLRDQGLSIRNARLLLDALADPADETANPLILRLAARLVKAGTVRPESLKRDIGRGRNSLDQELVQGVLYRRILAHIGDRGNDKALSALAHPGLVLRRVTPDIIARLLIPLIAPKERGKIDPDKLFDRLRREVWLVRETGPKTVEHRSDLRRTMLRLIDVDMRSQARRIHRAAIKYYRAGGEPGLDPDIAEGEAFYHRLMLTDRRHAGALKPADVRRFESMLLPSLDDLPPHVLAVVKSILDRPLTDEEGLALPEPRRTDFILRQGERCVLNDEPYRALELVKATDLHPLWELQALTTTVGWRNAQERGLLDPPATGGSSKLPSSEEPIERANLATWVSFCLGNSTHAETLAAGLLASLGPDMDWATFDSRLLEMVARLITYRTVAARDRGEPAGPEPRIRWGRLSEEHLGTTSMALEAARHAVLGIGDADSENRIVFSGESLPPSVKMLQQLSRSHLPIELKRKVGSVSKHLRTLRKGTSSGEILGDIARRFPKAVVVEPVRWPEFKERWRLVCPNPEFRGPAKFALLEAFKTQRELAIVAEFAWELVDLHPRDLEPDVFVKSAMRHNSPGAEIAKLVLYLDRSAVLGPFLQIMHREKPKAAKLAMVAAAFERWERALLPRS